METYLINDMSKCTAEFAKIIEEVLNKPVTKIIDTDEAK